MKFDFSKVNDNSLLPAGTYTARLTRTKPLLSSKGTPGILFIFEVTDPDYLGKTLFLNMYYSPTSMWRVQQILGGFGFYNQEELTSEDFDFNPSDLLGIEVNLQVSQQTYNNKLNNSVDQVMPIQPEDDYEAIDYPTVNYNESVVSDDQLLLIPEVEDFINPIEKSPVATKKPAKRK